MQQTTTKQNTFGTLVLEQVWSRLGKNYRYPCNEYYQLPYPLREFLSDYYPFGSSLPTRSWSDASRAYRYGFNGKEKDNETAIDDYDFGARIYDGRLGRWMSVDPLMKKYPSFSSFLFCLNSPILLIDFDGKEVYIHGADASKAVAALQKKTSLTIVRDVITGKITATGTAISVLDKELLKAINDQVIITNLYTTKLNTFQSKDGTTQSILIGGYDGSIKTQETIEGTEDTKEYVETTQYINIEQSVSAETAGVSNVGSDVFHEIIESYYGGQNDPGGTYNEVKWGESHSKALSADPLCPPVNKNLNSKTCQAGLINTANNKTVDLRPMTDDEKASIVGCKN